MELVNDFTVSVPVEKAWMTLTDVERIAPCLPGAQLQEIEGDTYRGVVKVKVGPISAQFKGEAHFVERDEENHRAVLKAAGRDTGGKGNASALITAQLEPKGDQATHVTVSTDLTITGKVAQFGRGALADVSSKLIGQFVEQLETTVLNEPGGAAGASLEPAAGASLEPAAAVTDAGSTAAEPAATAAPTATAPTATAPTATGMAAGESGASTAIRKVEGPEAEPVDLIEVAGPPMLKRLLPLVVAVLLIVFFLRRRRR